MKCPKCGKYNSDDSEICTQCGADLTDVYTDHVPNTGNNAAGEIYEDIKIIKSGTSPNLSGGSVRFKQKIYESKEYADIDMLKCPKCGSDNIQFVHETEKRGFKVGDSCCGYILLGPLGLLCGACGMNKESSTEFWVCNRCGAKFNEEDNNGRKFDIKRNVQLLLTAPDDTIENVDTIINNLNDDLKAMDENKKSIEKILSDLEEDEKQKNPAYRRHSNVSLAIELFFVLFIGGILLVALSMEKGFILGLIVTAVYEVVIMCIAGFIEENKEAKICSADFIGRIKELNDKSHAQTEEINKINADLKQLNKIKEAKDALTEKNIL